MKRHADVLFYSALPLTRIRKEKEQSKLLSQLRHLLRINAVKSAKKSYHVECFFNYSMMQKTRTFLFIAWGSLL